MRLLYKLWRDSEGVALIEYAALLPVLIILFYGIIEVTRHVQFLQKVDFATGTVGDTINQSQNLSCQDIAQVTRAIPLMMSPFKTALDTIVITAIQCDNIQCQHPFAKWQVRKGSLPSKIASTTNAQASVPDVTIKETDQVITVEMYAKYTTLINSDEVAKVLGFGSTGTEYKQLIARPRYGSFQIKPWELGSGGAVGCAGAL